jgi:hypothetical protein
MPRAGRRGRAQAGPHGPARSVTQERLEDADETIPAGGTKPPVIQQKKAHVSYKINTSGVKTLADVRSHLTKRQDIQLLHSLGQGCKNITLCGDGGVICVMPDKEVRVFPRHSHKAPTLFRAWVIAAGVALVVAVCTIRFSGVDGPSNAFALAAAFGFWLGFTSCWPRVTERKHHGMEALAAASTVFGLEALYHEERRGGDRGETTRAAVR